MGLIVYYFFPEVKLPEGLGFIGKFQRWVDWTLGCIAVTNSEMNELFRAVEIGTRIEIKP